MIFRAFKLWSDISFYRFKQEQVLDMATTPAVCSLMSLLPFLFLLQVQQQVMWDINSASYTDSDKHGH